MDEYDDDLDQVDEVGSQSGTEAPSEAAEDPRFKKLQNENRSLRERLRRTEIKAEHGEEIAGLIPPSLPLNEWADYAAKLASFRGATDPETPPQEAPAPAVQVDPEREERLAAVGQSRTGAAPDNEYDPKAIPDLIRTDPARAMALLKARHETR